MAVIGESKVAGCMLSIFYFLLAGLFGVWEKVGIIFY